MIDGTMVMADISGFTAMSEQLAAVGREGAEQLTDIINSFFGTMLDIAVTHGGDTLTFGGDALLMFFAGRQHARRAVAASMEMLTATNKLAAFHVGRGRIKLGMSMGAHTARFPFVTVGNRERAQFLTVGPDAARTANAESIANSGELVVTQETKDRLGSSAEFESAEAGMWLVQSTVDAGPAATAAPVDHAGIDPTILLPYLPPFAADALRTGEEPPPLEGEHRKVTVVFANITGVDALLANPDRSALVDELQTYLSDVFDLVQRYGGHLVSNDIYTDGFKLIVAFGVPVAHEHDAENAVRFVIGLRDIIAGRCLTLSHRFGVHRASVYAGDVGSAVRRQYTVMGDGVNLSARLMSAASPGQAIASNELACTLGPSFACTGLGSIRVKGKSAPIEICQLDAEKSGEATALPGLHSVPLVGRTRELAQLDGAIAQVGAGHGRVVLLSGEPGIGKSRLVDEVLARTADIGWTVIKTPCYEHTIATPFAPWIPMLERLFELGACPCDEAREAAVLDRVGALVPDLADYAPLLGPILSIQMKESRLTESMTPQARRRGILLLLTALVRAQASDAPFLFVIEDLHWADESSRELLEVLAADELGHTPLLLLLTTRPTQGPQLRLPPEFTVPIELEALPPEAAGELVEHAMGIANVPENVAQLLVRKTTGNPLFLEEMARLLAESGALERLGSGSDVAAAEELSKLDFPDHVQTLLMSRIDVLEPSPKQTLMIASVIGQVFDLGTIAMLECGEAATNPRVTDDAARLIELDLVVPTNGTSYRFRHALVQEVAYGSIRFDRRRDIHHRLATYLERRWAANPDAHLDEITRHFARSDDAPKTLEYSVRAADRARRMYAHREAIDYCRIALKASTARSTTSVLTRSGLVERMGDGYQIMGRHRDAIASYRNALERWARVENDLLEANLSPDALPPAVPEDSQALRERRAVLCHKIAMCYQHQSSRYDLCDKWVTEALEHMPPGPSPLRAWMYTTRCISLRRQGRAAEALHWAEEAVSCARQAHDESGLAWALNQLSLLQGDGGEPAKAVATQCEALGILEKIGDLERLASANGNLANCYEQTGDLDKALEHDRKALELDLRIGATDRVAIQRANIGGILVLLGQYEEAVASLEAALAASTEGGYDAFTGFILTNLSRAHAGMGDLKRARDCVERAVALLRRTRAHAVLAEATVQLAEVTRLEGQPAAAVPLCQRARAELLRGGNRTASIRSLRVQARALADLGDREAAHAAVNECIELAEEIGATGELALSRAACDYVEQQAAPQPA